MKLAAALALAYVLARKTNLIHRGTDPWDRHLRVRGPRPPV